MAARESGFMPGDAPAPVALARKALGGFFLCGILMSFLGAILPAWGYHVRSDYPTIGNYFLALNIGMLAFVTPAQRAAARKGLTFALVLGCVLASAGFWFLAATGPPVSHWYRFGGLVVLGASSAFLNTTLFHAISPMYRQDPAATVNLGGVSFGLGCLLTALVVSGAFYVYTTGAILFFLGAVPAFFAGLFVKYGFQGSVASGQPPLRQALDDFRSPAAVLFAGLLFFQFGNEWAIAGWLPLFLVQRLGVSPANSLLLLAFYWLALFVGRVAAQALLTRVPHGRLLIGSALSALFGCFILSFTNNQFGAATGLLFTGGGFSLIYPLVVEKIGSRFPYYHPGFFNGLFSLGVTGGLLAPWTLGYFAHWWGLGAVMALPLLGTCMVFLLLLVILLEARLSASFRRSGEV